MDQREKALRAGGKERHGPFTLYWEPYFAPDMAGYQQIHHGFTIDGTAGGSFKRWRYPTLAEADAQIEVQLKEHAVEIAKIALGLN